MNGFIKLVILSFALFTLGGCAFTKDTLVLNRQPTPISANAVMAGTKAPIQVKQFVDQRDGDPNLIAHKRNGFYMQTSGGFYAPQPVATIVQDAIASGLQSIGYNTTDHKGDYVLGGFVNNVKLRAIMGLVKIGVIIDVTTTLNLFDQNGRLLWSQTITGQDKEEAAYLGDNVVRIAFNKALDNVVQQLQESHSFKAAVRK